MERTSGAKTGVVARAKVLVSNSTTEGHVIPLIVRTNIVSSRRRSKSDRTKARAVPGTVPPVLNPMGALPAVRLIVPKPEI